MSKKYARFIAALILTAEIAAKAALAFAVDAQDTAGKMPNWQEIVENLVEHDNIRDIGFVSKAVNAPAINNPKLHASIFNRNSPSRLRYPNDENDIYSYYIIDPFAGSAASDYFVWVHGDRPPKADAAAAGAVLVIQASMPGDGSNCVKGLRDLLKSHGMTEDRREEEASMLGGPGSLFVPVKPGAIDKLVYFQETGPTNECATNITFMEMEHRYTPRGELEFHGHQQKQTADSPEKTALLDKVKTLLSHGTFRDVKFVSGLFGFPASYQQSNSDSSKDIKTLYAADKTPVNGMKLTYGVEMPKQQPDSGMPIAALLSIEAFPANICITRDDLRSLFKSEGMPARDNKDIATHVMYSAGTDRYVFEQDNGSQVRATVSIGVNVVRAGFPEVTVDSEPGDRGPDWINGDLLANVEPAAIPASMKTGDIFAHNPCANSLTFEEIDRTYLKQKGK